MALTTSPKLLPLTTPSNQLALATSPKQLALTTSSKLQASPRAPEQRMTLFMTSDLKRRLEKLSRHYDVETMKVFMVVEALGESNIHAVYNPSKKSRWQQFLQRHEACRVDHSRHEKTRQHYQHFLKEVGREDQGRLWFVAVLQLLHQFGATDMFQYLTTHSTSSSSSTTGNNSHHHHHHHHSQSNSNSPRRYERHNQLPNNTHRSNNNTNLKAITDRSYNTHNSKPHTDSPRIATDRSYKTAADGGYKALDSYRSQHNNKKALESGPRGSLTSLKLSSLSSSNSKGAANSEFCNHLVRLFEKKLETWFDSFQAVAVKLTAHVKVSGLVRVLSGQVHALVTRKGKLTALVIKVTQQETPRPLDVCELCLNKVMIIQNGLALPEELGLALLILHIHPARPVLRLWQLTPTSEIETAIRTADIDDMIDAGRLSQHHELWADNSTTDTSPTIDLTTNTTNGNGNDNDDDNLSTDLHLT